MPQTTLAEPVHCRGVGLHSGEAVEVVLYPAPPDHGIRFVRVDLARSTPEVSAEGRTSGIPATADFLRAADRATTLGEPDGSGEKSVGAGTVTTVEHLLASVSMLAIDNVRVEVDGAELPAMDGSASPWVELLARAGRVEQGADRRVVAICETHEIRVGDRFLRLSPVPPGHGLAIDYTIDFPHPAIGRQTISFSRIDEDVFSREIAGARTFGFIDEVKALRAAGLGRGGGLDNTIVLDAQGVINSEGLRWPDECVRHKVLDLIGDLVLFGAPLEGRIEVERGGHALHHALVRRLREDPSLWQERVDVAEGSGAGATSLRNPRAPGPVRRTRSDP